jgi:hypothetical protein
VSGLNIGYARVSTDQQDLTAQRDGLQALGVAAERIYVDHGLTGTNRDRPGLHQAQDRTEAGRQGRSPPAHGGRAAGSSYNRMLWTALRGMAAYLPGC